MEYIALGNFDGMHKGHQELLSQVVEAAHNDGAQTGICLFEPHPMKLVNPNKAPKLLTSLSLRKKLLASIGIDNIHIIPFDEDMLNMDGISFLDMIRSEYDAGMFAVGYNFTFGKKGAWKEKELKQYCAAHDLKSIVLDKYMLDGEEVSSTIIRGHIVKGELDTACRLLGRPHLIEGRVVVGNKLGRQIDFPTANFVYELDYCYPPHGVYFTTTMIDKKWYYSITNIGKKPTVDKDMINIETHVLDYSGELYGKKIQIGFFCKLRDQQKFADVQELKAQLIRDEQNARDLIPTYKDDIWVCNKYIYTL
jgi:riboflavin kinase/FMN adenylyltransferase